MSGERITIVLSEKNRKKLREIQARMIRQQSRSVSFSAVINLIVEKGLK